MSEAWIDALEDMALRRAGLTLHGLNRNQIEARLARLARREGYDSPEALSRAAFARPEERLAYEVVETLVPGQTRFFGAGFKAFETVILPQLARRAAERPARIWSAGCGTGQEAYSIAMTIEDAGGDVRPERFEIAATDYSESAIETAQAGRYSRFEVQLGLPIRNLLNHFEQDGEMWRVKPRLRRGIEFRALNLMADLSSMQDFDVIFLRGVVSWMPADVAEKTLSRAAARLRPGAWLILGAGERSAQTFGRLQETTTPGLYQTAERVPA